MRFCKKRTGPDDVSRTARAIASKTGTSKGNASRTQAQSKKRLAPDRDQGLSRFSTTEGEGRAVDPGF